MNKELNATCAICGNRYHMCLTCKSIMELNPWKVHTDTSEHYKIYQILHGYSVGVYNKEEAKLKLETVDLSDLNNLRDHIKELINYIMTEDKANAESVVDKDLNAGNKKRLFNNR